MQTKREVYVRNFTRRSIANDEEYSKYVATLTRILDEKCDNEVEVFGEIMKRCNRKQLVKALKENNTHVPSDVCYKFIHLRVLPELFSPNCSDDDRNELFSLIMSTPLGFAFTHMKQEEIVRFKRDILKNYLPFITKTNLGPFWWKYCVVLIHYCGNMIHNELEITNGILQIIEDGFKTKTISSRLEAFRCWRELVLNYSKDPKYIRNHKQITLLLKPLKIKLSKSSTLAGICLDIYMLLMENLQNNTQLVDDFLTFCFGPFGAGDKGADQPAMKNHIEYCPKLTEILLKYIGHNRDLCCHNKNTFVTNCFNVEAIYNSENILENTSRITTWLKVCTINLTKVANDYELTTQCLWSNYFNLLKGTKLSTDREALDTIYSNISEIGKEATRNDKAFICYKTILRCLASLLDQISFHANIVEKLILPLIKDIVFLQVNNPNIFTSSIYQCIIKDFINYSLKYNNFLNEIKLLYKSEYAEILKDIQQIIISHIANDIDKNMVLNQEVILTIIKWNVLHNNECHSTMEFDILEYINITAPDLKEKMLNELDALVKDDEKLASNAWIFALFLLSVVTDKDKLFFSNVLELMLRCAAAKHLEDNVKPHIVTGMQKACDIMQGLHFQFIKPLMLCFEALIKNHQLYEILPTLKQYIVQLSKYERREIPASLSSVLTNGIYGQKSITIGRLACEIGHLLYDPSKHIVKRTKSLTLFGSELNSTTAANNSKVEIKGSLLNNLNKTTPTKSASTNTSTKSTPTTNNNKSSQNINDVRREEFAVINTVVTFDKSKLNEHQKEKLKRSNADIPALYQDLSRSQSDSNSQTNGSADIIENSMEVDSRPIIIKNASSNTSIVMDESANDIPEKLDQDKLATDVDKSALEEDERRKRNTERTLRLLKIDVVNGDEYQQQRPTRTRKAKKIFEFEDPVEKRRPRRTTGGAAGDAANNTTPELTTPPNTKTSTKKGKKPSMTDGKENNTTETNNDGETTITTPTTSQGKDKVVENNVKAITSPSKRISTLEDIIIKAANEPATPPVSKAANKPKSPNKSALPKPTTTTGLTNYEPIHAIITSPKESGENNTIQSPIKIKILKSALPKRVLDTKEGIQNLESESTQTTKIKKMILHNVGVINEITQKPRRHSLDEKSPPSAAKRKNERNTKQQQQQNEETPKGKMIKSPEKRSPRLSASPPELKVCLNRLDIKSITRKNLSDLSTQSIGNDSKIDDSLTIPDNTHDITTSDISSLDLVLNVSANSVDQQKQQQVIGSPVTHDTPDRTSALLNNTVDISPIKADPDSDDLFVSEDVADVKSNDDFSILKQPSSRSHRLLNLVNQASEPMDSLTKLMSSSGKAQKKISNHDVLKFEREIPSPIATPKISILKRKTMESEDAVSPCPKRKRVNFSDPPITCEKIYYKDEHPKENPKRRRVNMMTSCRRSVLENVCEKTEIDLTQDGPSSPTSSLSSDDRDASSTSPSSKKPNERKLKKRSLYNSLDNNKQPGKTNTTTDDDVELTDIVPLIDCDMLTTDEKSAEEKSSNPSTSSAQSSSNNDEQSNNDASKSQSSSSENNNGEVVESSSTSSPTRGLSSKTFATVMPDMINVDPNMPNEVFIPSVMYSFGEKLIDMLVTQLNLTIDSLPEEERTSFMNNVFNPKIEKIIKID